jgi:hemerythrin-like domain-containing protein
LITDIDQRTGWPEHLLTLLRQYPRESWRHQSSPMTQFWLDKHDYFRGQCRNLQDAADDYRADRKAPEEFGGWIAPRLQGFLGALHGHHQIEDFHYFPAFREAEQGLAAGFDVLARDHELVHQGIVEIVETVNAFLSALREDTTRSRDALRHAGDRYIETSEVLFRRLCRHLDDEEDLIIPIMLDRQ